MIKTFQKKVIITAMTAITILLAVFIGAINIANYIALDNQSDRILDARKTSGGGKKFPFSACQQGYGNGCEVLYSKI